MERQFNYPIMEEIKNRWSPRAFSQEKIDRDLILGLLEGARYAPSCFNEQPWRYIIADNEESLAKMRPIMYDSNRVWADKAPVLILLCSKNTFDYNGNNNYWNMFDAGTAWGYLSLEAEKNGLISHAMGGFSRKKAKEVYNLDDTIDVIAVVALGKYGDKNDLPEELQEREKPDTRKKLEDLILDNCF